MEGENTFKMKWSVTNRFTEDGSGQAVAGGMELLDIKVGGQLYRQGKQYTW